MFVKQASLKLTLSVKKTRKQVFLGQMKQVVPARVKVVVASFMQLGAVYRKDRTWGVLAKFSADPATG